MSEQCKHEDSAQIRVPGNATIRRSQDEPKMFSVTISRHSRRYSSVERMDGPGLAWRLREWNLREQMISTILNLPAGMAITLKLDELEARRGESPKPWLVA